MRYNELGKTGIKVSQICLGTMTWGEQNTLEQACSQMDFATERGVNFFDVAELYPVPPRPETQGKTEEFIGEWFKRSGKRDEIFLASKVTGRSDANGGSGHIRNGARLSKEHIFSAVESSLKRLNTDVIDLYQVHWPERRTNFFGQLGYTHSDDDGIEIEETLSALGEICQQGKVRYIGISNETPWGLMQYLNIAEKMNLPRISTIQNPYNLLNRTFEIGLSEMSIREKVGLLAYSPLAFGALSGKYRNNNRPENARLTLYERFGRYLGNIPARAIESYCQLAEENGLTPAQMALAFVNNRDFLTSNIIGATSIAQLEENISTSEITLSKNLLNEIDKIHHCCSNPAP